MVAGLSVVYEWIYTSLSATEELASAVGLDRTGGGVDGGGVDGGGEGDKENEGFVIEGIRASTQNYFVAA